MRTFLAAYHRRLNADDPEVRSAAAVAWSRWEAEIVTLLPNPELVAAACEDQFALAVARIETHYMINGGWLDEGQLLRDIGRIRHIPGVIVQGRYDSCTPPRTAWDLHRAWPEAEFHIVPYGHVYNEPGILDRLIRATDAFAAADELPK